MDNYMIYGQFVEYKGYIGSIEYSLEDAVFYGRLLNTDDLVTYEGEEIYSLYNNYLEAIDDYIKFGEEIEEEGDVDDEPHLFLADLYPNLKDAILDIDLVASQFGAKDKR